MEPEIQPRPTIITGLPGQKREKGRVDFRPDQFDLAIQTKGYRVYWSRAAVCPCRNNEQTDQPDVACDLCKGQGRFYFLPDVNLENYSTDLFGNPIELSEDKQSLLILALITQVSQDPQIFEKFGEWTFGTIKISVQHQNRIGFRDRIQLLDSIMAWGQLIEYNGAETIEITGGYDKAGLRYPIVDLHILRSTDTIFKAGVDFEVTQEGKIRWIKNAPAEDTVLSINYLIRPVYQIIEHVNSFRDTLVAAKRQAANKKMQHTKLPIHGLAKLDFLVDGES
jgi:hypothetical protein